MKDDSEQRWFVKSRINFQVSGEKGGLWPEYPKISEKQNQRLLL